MQTLCLTGWQQKHDALANIMPDALHFDYASYDNVEGVFAALPREPDVAVGWSLGGQLLARAISARYIRPKKLVLIATPFTFVASDDFSEGTIRAAFEGMRQGYSDNAAVTLKGFQTLIGLGDEKQSEVVRSLCATKQVWDNGLFWLDELGRFSCRDLHFRLFPETVIIHGQNDKIATVANATRFAKSLPGAALVVVPGCAHAPHLHDAEMIRQVAGGCV